MRLNRLFPIVASAVLVASACSRDASLQRDQKSYEVVQEGAAGATNPNLTDGTAPAPMTGTAADTTTAFDLPAGATGSVASADSTLAGSMPPAYTSAAPMPPQYGAPAPRIAAAPVRRAEPQPAAPPRDATPQPAPAADMTSSGTDTSTTAEPSDSATTSAPPPADSQKKEEKPKPDTAPPEQPPAEDPPTTTQPQ